MPYNKYVLKTKENKLVIRKFLNAKMIITCFCVLCLSSCAHIRYSSLTDLSACDECRLLAINDPALITGQVSYPVEGLDFWIMFPDRRLAIHALKPTFHNNSFTFVFRFHPMDTGMVMLVAGNSFGGGKVWRYIDTIFALKDLRMTENLLMVRRLPKRIGAGVWQPTLQLIHSKWSNEKTEVDKVVIDYSLTYEKMRYSRWNRFVPSLRNYEKVVQRYRLSSK